jgi:hypothetical protein
VRLIKLGDDDRISSVEKIQKIEGEIQKVEGEMAAEGTPLPEGNATEGDVSEGDATEGATSEDNAPKED